MKRDASERLPFFVYGTLIPGQPNEHLWGQAIETAETAVFDNSQLYDMEYYPMLVEQRSGSVFGKLITVKDQLYLDTLVRLDALEGFIPDQPLESTYRRVKRDVTTSAGRMAASWVYVGRMEYVDESQLITGGDWVAYTAGNQSQMAAWWKFVHTVFGRHGDMENKDR